MKLLKTVYDKLVTKINNIDTSGFVLKIQYSTDKSNLDKKFSDGGKKVPDTSGLVKKTDYNSKISEIESKIPSTSALATNSALTAVENKIPDVSNLVKKTDYDVKILDTEKKVADHDHDKYITASEFHKLPTENFATRLTQANLVTKTGFNTKLMSLNRKINSNKTKHILVENE